MASILMLPFLRPLNAPRAATIRHFLRFSTSTQCCKSQQTTAPPKRQRPAREPARETKTRDAGTQDHNLMASYTASPSYPPPTMTSLPRPKVSKSSRRTSHPQKDRPYPTRQPSHQKPAFPKLIPDPVTPLAPEYCAPNLAYFVTRTRSNELPVYQDRKRGGNLKLTLVRKIDGEPEVLRDALREALGLGKEECLVNPLTRQVVMKGHIKPRVDRFLRERMF